MEATGGNACWRKLTEKCVFHNQFQILNGTSCTPARRRHRGNNCKEAPDADAEAPHEGPRASGETWGCGGACWDALRARGAAPPSARKRASALALSTIPREGSSAMPAWQDAPETLFGLSLYRDMPRDVLPWTHGDGFDVLQGSERTRDKFESIATMEPAEKFGDGQACSDQSDKRDANRA